MWISDNVVSIACIACQVPEHKSLFPSLDLLCLAEFKHVFEHKTFISFSHVNYGNTTMIENTLVNHCQRDERTPHKAK